MSDSQKFSLEGPHNINLLLRKTNVRGQNKFLLKRGQNNFQNFFSELALILFQKSSIIMLLTLVRPVKVTLLWRKTEEEEEEEEERD